MAEATVRLHPLAADEAEAAYAWYLARNATVSEAFLQELDAAMRSIANAPERWPNLHGRYRRYLLHRFPFSVVYSCRGELVDVVAVAHHRRKPSYWRNR